MRRGRRSALFAGKRSLPIKIAIGVVLLVVLIVVLIPSGKRVTSTAEVAKIRSRGALRVLVNVFPTKLYNSSGMGVEAKIAKKTAELIFGDDFDESSDIVFIPISKSFMDSYFADASADIALLQCANGLYPSKYAYSDAYYVDKCLIITRMDKAADMDLCGTTIGVLNSDICEKRLDSYNEKNKANITKKKYPTYETMLTALKLGDLDACIMTATAYSEFAESGLREHETKLGDVQYSVVCDKENEGLCEVINSAIAELKKAGEI